jgi:MFS family permease
MASFSNSGLTRESNQSTGIRLFPVTIIASGTFAWWFLITVYFGKIYSSWAADQLWIGVLAAIFYGSGAISAIPGSMFGERINRRKFLSSYFTFGLIATVLLALQPSLVLALISSALLGISFGLGFPSCFALLADSTSKKERARFTGIIVLETFVMVFLGVVTLSVVGVGPIAIVAVAVVLRATSYIGLVFSFPQRSKEKGDSWLSILASRNLVLYLLPWLAFNLAGELVGLVWNGLLRSSSALATAYSIGDAVRMASIALIGVLAGIRADRIGRKPLIIVGLVALGFGFAFLGLATSEWSVLFYLMISGVAWSLLMVSYFALFGDLAFPKATEKFYALGIATPLLTYMLVRGIMPILSITRAEANVLSPIMAMLIFVSVIPALYASETLPAEAIRERELKEHVEKLGKIIQESNEDHAN